MKPLFVAVVLTCLLAVSGLPVSAGDSDTGPQVESHPDPLNASYSIEGQTVRLIQGRNETAVAPGSAAIARTVVLGQPVYGDITGNGTRDAALLLVHDPGGSGTFYYVAVGRAVGHRYQGTNAVLLGDRIIPRDIAIVNSSVKVNYSARRPEEPMSAAPSLPATSFFILANDRLETVTPQYDGERILEGWVTIGHEVRSFEPCRGRQVLWLMGDAPALPDIKSAYLRTRPEAAAPYRKVLMLLGGEAVAPPTDGFGAEYEAGFKATRLVRVTPGGDCTGNALVFDSPADITGVEWQWEQTLYNDDQKAAPAEPSHYTITFNPDGTVAVRADCNRAGGVFTRAGKRLAINVTHSTMAMCPPDSLDQKFLKGLGAAALYFLKNGYLYLDLQYDTGTMKFRP